jgi:hypothetical protein
LPAAVIPVVKGERFKRLTTSQTPSDSSHATYWGGPALTLP